MNNVVGIWHETRSEYVPCAIVPQEYVSDGVRRGVIQRATTVPSMWMRHYDNQLEFLMTARQYVQVVREDERR